MLVDAGRVVARDANIVGEASVVDCTGKFLLPSFIDSHCHVLPLGLDLQKLNLGNLDSRVAILEAVRDRHRSHPDGWLMCVQYDQNRFSDGQHITVQELDAISGDRPIALRHSNGHAGVVNSAALRAAGVDQATPDPEGGSYGRDASGQLSGLLLEIALEHVFAKAPMPNVEEMTSAILAAGELMASRGISGAHDMMTGSFNLCDELHAYRLAAERGCKVRTRLYIQWSALFGGRAVLPAESLSILDGLDSLRCRIAGVKIFADGAIASATAAIYGRYSGEEAKGPVISRRARLASETSDTEVSGQLIYSPERLNSMVMTAHNAGYQVSIHSIGDYATDLVMNAFEATDEPSRHRIEHAMLLSDAQIERMAGLGIYCAYQPEFLHQFGAAYARQLGPERSKRLKRIRSTIDAGIPVSLSSDAPIVTGDPWLGIRTATNRQAAFGDAENCTLAEAIIGYTHAGAEICGDDQFGALNPGQLAEFNMLDSLPV